MHRWQRGSAVRIDTENSPEMTNLSVRPVLTITLTKFMIAIVDRGLVSARSEQKMLIFIQ